MDARRGEDLLVERMDPAKYELVKKVIAGTAFAAPVVASFSIDGLSIYDAKASVIGNQI